MITWPTAPHIYFIRTARELVTWDVRIRHRGGSGSRDTLGPEPVALDR